MTPHQIAKRAKFIPLVIPDPGTGNTIVVDRNFGIVPVVTGASGETNTMSAPFRAGVEVTITMRTDGGGDRVITPTGGFLNTSAAAATTITLNDVNDTIRLISIQTGATTFQWLALVNIGCTLA